MEEQRNQEIPGDISLQRITMEIKDLSLSSSGNLPDTKVRNQTIQKWVQGLVHASQCRINNCNLPECHKIKRLFRHTRHCKSRRNGCPICKQFVALCSYHSKNCQDFKCTVPFCENTKYNIKQHELKRR